MRRGWLAALAVVIVGGGVALALATGVLGGDGDPTATTTGEAVATTAPTTTSPRTTGSSVTTTVAAETTTSEDPLCLAFEGYARQIEGHLPVEEAEDLEIFLTAGVDFYTKAVALVEPPEQGAFAEILAYQQAQREFSEGHDWNPSPPLEELLENPPPTAPASATQIVADLLEDRCGVEIVRE